MSLGPQTGCGPSAITGGGELAEFTDPLVTTIGFEKKNRKEEGGEGAAWHGWS